MTQQLSPAAKAVLDAWEEKLSPDVTCLTHDPERESLAAALRAAVQQTGKRKALKALGVTMAQGPAYCLVSDLLAIADELEAQ